MKTSFSHTLSIAGFLLAAAVPRAAAAEVLWTALAGSSTAWIIGSNWDGGNIPLGGDVAQFNNVGAAALSYSMAHALNPTPNQANIGAVQMLSTRVTNDLSISSHSASASTWFYHGQTVNGIDRTIIANESGRNLSLISTGGGAAQIGLSASADSVIQINGAGNVSINLPMSGAGSRLVLRQGASGSGTVTLQGANSTYSGGTHIQGSGTLLIAASGAAGTGTITNAGGTLRIGADLTVTNSIVLTSETATYERLFESNNSYAVYSVAGNLGGDVTTASLLGGSAGAARTLESAFTMASLASNDAFRLGEVFQLTGTEGDIHVLQLSLNLVPTGSYLGWLDGGEWVNAIKGNSTTGSLAVQNFQGSFANSGAAASIDYLGSWGYDADTNAVWAVLNDSLSGSFAVLTVPEPSALILALAAGLLLVLRSRRFTHLFRREV